MFRPGLIQPLDGIVPKSKWVKGFLAVFKPLFPPLMALFPRHITTTRRIGRAMLAAAREDIRVKWVESWDINKFGQVDQEAP